MYSCLGIAGNIFSVRANAVNELSTKTILQKKKHVPTKNNPPPIPTLCNISRQIPFSIQFSSTIIIILWFCLNSRWIGCLIFISRSRERPPAVLRTQIVRTHPISAKIHKSETVYFLIKVCLTKSADLSVFVLFRIIIIFFLLSYFSLPPTCVSRFLLYFLTNLNEIWHGHSPWWDEETLEISNQ